jgi:hypothetical protein
MTSSDPSDELDVELTDEWAAAAKKSEASADERVQRYAAISQAHQHAKPPRSWTPGSSASSSSTGSTSGETWIKVTAIVLIAIAVFGVLSLLRALG